MSSDEQDRILNEWLAAHRGVIFKIVRAYAFDHHDQEDLFQEIATQVWNSIPNYRGESKVTTWIYRVALFCAIAWSKRERRHRDRQTVLDREGALLLARPEKSNPRIDWLYEQISRLDVIDRSLTLMMLDGCSYAEIADTLGLTESNVGVKLNRIRKRLTEQSNREVQRGL